MSTEPPTGDPPAGSPPTQPWYAQIWLRVAAIVGAVVIAIIVVLVVLAGGDDDDDSDETVQASPTVEAEATEALGGDGGEDEDGDIGGTDGGTAGDTDGGTAGDTDGGTAGDTAGGDDPLAALREAVSGAESGFEDIKVIYDIVQPQFKGQWTVAQRPPSDSLVEIRRIDSEAGTEFITSVITTAASGVARIEPQPNSRVLLPLLGQTVSYVCSGFDAQGSCFLTDATEAEAQTAPVDALYLIPQQLVQSGITGVVSTSSDNIADQSATCFTADLLDDPGTSEFCFSNNSGLPLRVRSEDTLFEATFVGPPTDEDFECCPYEVIDLGDFEIAPIPMPEVPAN